MADKKNHSEANDQTKVNPIQVQKFLKGLKYSDGPVFREQILETAKKNGADEKVMSTLKQIPDKEYNGPNEVTHQISEAPGGFSENADSHDKKSK